MAEKIILVSGFPYQYSGGIYRTAMRGDKVDIPEAEDIERGERLGAFASDDDLAEGAPFRLWLDANRPEVLAGDEPDPVATQPADPSNPLAPGASSQVHSPASEDVSEVPAPGGRDSREKWAAYARTRGASDTDVAPVDQGGLTRDQLRERYGA